MSTIPDSSNVTVQRNSTGSDGSDTRKEQTDGNGDQKRREEQLALFRRIRG
eukprot:CAMPEP_0172457442 /NCGR_PEP_ID=MMETSP1065-20121228/22323_1 /TAXON_ID=265537 /ORGANISM="Amphiprora paludosa, Strain CCMP125" /LENGTH=50 /DNA_ID=CAMNT_0013211193 /DNA_START=24 /DNA_END=172 /DNA_ORIENTATION=+